MIKQELFWRIIVVFSILFNLTILLLINQIQTSIFCLGNIAKATNESIARGIEIDSNTMEILINTIDRIDKIEKN